MKLRPKQFPYSSIVGGGISLFDESGRARFIINLMGTTHGISKAQYDTLSEQLIKMIMKDGLEAPAE